MCHKSGPQCDRPARLSNYPRWYPGWVIKRFIQLLFHLWLNWSWRYCCIPTCGPPCIVVSWCIFGKGFSQPFHFSVSKLAIRILPNQNKSLRTFAASWIRNLPVQPLCRQNFRWFARLPPCGGFWINRSGQHWWETPSLMVGLKKKNNLITLKFC